MKRKIVTVIMIVICFLLQTTLFTKITFATIRPNFLIILTSSVGFMRGRKGGMFTGMICGIFADLFWGHTLGFFMAVYILIGYFNGTFRRIYYTDDLKLPILLVGISELMYGCVTYFCTYLLLGDFSIWTNITTRIFPELVYTVLATLVVYPIILWVNKKLEAEEQRSASKFV